MTYRRFQAWDLVGFDGTMEVIDRLHDGDPNYAEPGYQAKPACVRIVGGRALYECVSNHGGRDVRLERLDVTADGLRTVSRYVPDDTLLEVVTA